MLHRLTALLVLMTALILAPALAAKDEIKAAPAPPAISWWWDDTWWEQGQIPVPTNYPVETRWVSYMSGATEIPALVARPRGKGKFPAVLYMHGRRGLDDLIQMQVKRLAARGFVVLAPDVYKAHFIPPMPIEHDYKLEANVNDGVDALLKLPDVSTRKACLASNCPMAAAACALITARLPAAKPACGFSRTTCAASGCPAAPLRLQRRTGQCVRSIWLR